VAVVVACDGENGSVRATAEALRLRPAWHQRRSEKEIGHGNAGLLPGSAFVDETESVRELMWPQSRLTRCSTHGRVCVACWTVTPY
jgi:hypothetical protein